MQEVLILGYGNTLRGDDAFGRRVAELLEQEYEGNDQFRVIPCHQLTPDLAETLSHFRTVVFIDASCEQLEEGVRCVSISHGDEEVTFSHHVTPSTLLATCNILYNHQPQAFVVSVAGRSFELGEEMSPNVQALIPEAQQRIREITKIVLTGEDKNLSCCCHSH